MSSKKKYMAYVLNKDPELGYSQSDIAKLMKVTQSTIHNAIKDVKYEVEIRDLTCQLEEARKKIIELNLLPEPDVFYIE